MMDRTFSDLLSDVLASIHLRASVYANPSVCGTWQIDPSEHPGAQFHLIARGSCFLLMPDQPPRALRAGDLCVFPRGAVHLISSEPTTLAQGTWQRPALAAPYTSLVCGQFVFEEGSPTGLLESLPEVVVVPAEAVDERFSALLKLLADESLRGETGSAVVLDRLADALFVMVLRYHIAHSRERRGLLAAAADPRMAATLLALHREPGKPWSVGEMAWVAGMSRTAFAQRFAELMQTTPMAYLTHWRMLQAQRLFRDPRNSVARVAEQLGYETEAAFRRAFKRVVGLTPGYSRRHSGRAPMAQAETVETGSPA